MCRRTLPMNWWTTCSQRWRRRESAVRRCSCCSWFPRAMQVTTRPARRRGRRRWGRLFHGGVGGGAAEAQCSAAAPHTPVAVFARRGPGAVRAEPGVRRGGVLPARGVRRGAGPPRPQPDAGRPAAGGRQEGRPRRAHVARLRRVRLPGDRPPEVTTKNMIEIQIHISTIVVFG